jgi:hypothetical protein
MIIMINFGLLLAMSAFQFSFTYCMLSCDCFFNSWCFSRCYAVRYVRLLLCRLNICSPCLAFFCYRHTRVAFDYNSAAATGTTLYCCFQHYSAVPRLWFLLYAVSLCSVFLPPLCSNSFLVCDQLATVINGQACMTCLQLLAAKACQPCFDVRQQIVRSLFQLGTYTSGLLLWAFLPQAPLSYGMRSPLTVHCCYLRTKVAVACSCSGAVSPLMLGWPVTGFNAFNCACQQ